MHGLVAREGAGLCRLRLPGSVGASACSFGSESSLLARQQRRWVSSGGAGRAGGGDSLAEKNTRIMYYIASVVIGAVGMSYAVVPLYKAFCQAYGFGGTTNR